MPLPIIFITISIVLFIIAIKLNSTKKYLKNTGINTKGTIIQKKFDPLLNSGNLSYPEVRFLTENKEWITVTSKIGVFPFAYKLGQEVSIIYEKENPKNFIINERFIQIVPAIMIAMSILFFSIGIYSLIHK
jgi:hypothetical protein